VVNQAAQETEKVRPMRVSPEFNIGPLNAFPCVSLDAVRSQYRRNRLKRPPPPSAEDDDDDDDEEPAAGPARVETCNSNNNSPRIDLIKHNA
jgi:hypothetical protein